MPEYQLLKTFALAFLFTVALSYIQIIDEYIVSFGYILAVCFISWKSAKFYHYHVHKETVEPKRKAVLITGKFALTH